jgi:hypothetical protein
MPSTDIMKGIDTIMGKAKSNSYTSQFEMDLEIKSSQAYLERTLEEARARLLRLTPGAYRSDM